MCNFATYDDVLARYPAASHHDRATVETLIGDATALMLSTCETPVNNKNLLTFICCSVVRRALASAGDTGEIMAGVSQTSQTVGAFSQSWSFSNPAGDLYLTRAEKRLLRGVNAMQAGFNVSLKSGDPGER